MNDVSVTEEKSLSSLEKIFKDSFSVHILKDVVNIKLKEKQKSAKASGFRDGQVPFFILEKQYKDLALKEAIEEKTKGIVSDVVKQYQDGVVGTPNINNFKNTDTGIIDFNITFEIFAQYDMPNFDEISLNQYSIDVSDEEIDSYIEVVKKNSRELDKDFDGLHALLGDVVTIDFDSVVDENVYEVGSQKNARFELGSGRFLPDFENKIVGASKGDKLAFEMRFPDDYEVDSNVAGKLSRVSVIVQDIERYLQSPELNDKFAERYGCNSVSELRYKVADFIRDDVNHDLFIVNKLKLFDALENILSFNVPKSLFEKENASLKNNLELKKQVALSDEQYEDYCEKLALRKLRIGILIADYVKLNNIKVDDKEFENHVMSQVDKHPDKRSEIINYYKENASSWYSMSLEEKAVMQILSQKVNLIDVEKTLEEMREIVIDLQKHTSRIG